MQNKWRMNSTYIVTFLQHPVQILPIAFLVIDPIEPVSSDICFVPAVVKETLLVVVAVDTTFGQTEIV